MNTQHLNRCSMADINRCNPNTLAELRDMTIDTSLPRQDRMVHFVRQAGNPYLFKIDGTVVKVNYGGSKSLSSALSALLISR